MTELSKNRQYDNLYSAVDFALKQKLKNIYTCLPGVVEGDSYDKAARTVDVRGALNVMTSDTNPPSAHRREVVKGVPIVYPCAGPYRIQFPLAAGDPVLLLYSQRGLDHWKTDHGIHDPAVRFFEEIDAICVPGFGPGGSSPPSGDGLVIEMDGGPAIELNGAGVTIRGDLIVTGTINP